MRIKKITVSVVLSLMMLFSLNINGFCTEVKTQDDGILCIAHEGDRGDFSPASSEAVTSAFKKGADYVSVRLAKTADGVYVLCPGKDYDVIRDSLEKASFEKVKNGTVSVFSRGGTVCSLGEASETARKYGKKIIIDGQWDNRSGLFAFLKENCLTESVILRTDASEKEISEFLSDTGNSFGIIREYHGNILFSARRAISFAEKNALSGVCLGTKNSFGVIFHQTVLSCVKSQIIMIKTYDVAESGERPDTSFSWNDLTDRGYNCFETDRLDELLDYRESTEKAAKRLRKALDSAKNIDISVLSKSSSNEIKNARDKGELLLEKISSFDSLSRAESELNTALRNMTGLKDGEKNSQGAFAVTPGRVTAIVLVTAALFCMQMFFFYAQAGKKKPGFMKNIFK